MATQNFTSNVSTYIKGRFTYSVTNTSITVSVQLWRTNKYSSVTGSSGSSVKATIDGGNQTTLDSGYITIPATSTANSSYSSSNGWSSSSVTFSGLDPGTSYEINIWGNFPNASAYMNFDEYINITTSGSYTPEEPDTPVGITLATISTTTPTVTIGQTCKYRLANTDYHPSKYYWYYVELYLGSQRVYYEVFREGASGLTNEKTINIPNTLMSYISATSTYGTGYLIVETYLGNSREPDYDLLQGSNQVGVTFNTTNYGLSTGTVSVTAASTPIANTYIQNKTTLNIGWNSIAPSLGANLTLLEVIYGDMIKTYKTSAIQPTSSFVTIPIMNSGNVEVYIRVTDSRGYTATSTKTTLSVVEYQFPQPTMTVERYNGTQPDSRGNTIKSLIDWTYSTLSGRNSITKRELWLTPINEGQWTKVISTVEKNVLQTLPGTYTQSQSYQVKFIIEDTVGSHIEKVVNIGTEPVIMDLHHGGDGLALGKVSEDAGLEISYPTKFDNGTTYGEIGSIIWFGDPGKEYGLRIDDEDVIVYFNGESFNLYDTLTDFERRITALEERG